MNHHLSRTVLVHLGSADDHDWLLWTSPLATHALAHHKSKKDHILPAALYVELTLFCNADHTCYQMPCFAVK